jgi:hypothetical protein
MIHKKHKVRSLVLISLSGLVLSILMLTSSVVRAQAGCKPNNDPNNTTICSPEPVAKTYFCGDAGKTTAGALRRVYTTINIGCYGQGNAILDATFAIIRMLSVGVGVVITASMTVAGIMYIMARDDPGAVSKAKERIQSNLIALLIFIFASAILGWLLPVGFLK